MSSSERLYRQAKEEARSLGHDAKERVSQFAEARKDAVSESLEEFAAAIERASDELTERDHTVAAQIVQKAAESLGGLSRSIGGSSAPELVNSLRRFGRDNPAAFIGSAVLAGLALGRFARASGASDNASGASDNHGRDTTSPYADRFAPNPGSPQPGGPNSATDASVGVSSPSAAAQPGSISTGGTQ